MAGPRDGAASAGAGDQPIALHASGIESTTPLIASTLLDDLPPDAAETDPNYRAVLAWAWGFSERPRTPAERAAQWLTKVPRMAALLSALGDPQHGYPVILCAGTKGKGSSVAMMASCLSAAGYRTGRYTSPHLVNWRERVCLDGAPIDTRSVVDLVDRLQRAVERVPAALGSLTTFEVGTALAFLYFAEREVDVAVIEVGVGGRTDATNLSTPTVSAITPVGLDHCDVLGTSLAAIASHKAGVMRPARATVLARQPPPVMPVFEAEAARLGTRLPRVGSEWDWQTDAASDAFRVHGPNAETPPLRLPLLGRHQRDNACLAVATLFELGRARPHLAVHPAALVDGLAGVQWPARFQVVSGKPTIVVDGAHDASSAEVARDTLRDIFGDRQVHLVLGVTEGKDASAIARALVPSATTVWATRSVHARAAAPEVVAAAARPFAAAGAVHVASTLGAALDRALGACRGDDLVLVTGSLFLAGETLVEISRGRGQSACHRL